MQNKISLKELLVRGGLKAVDGAIYDVLRDGEFTVAAIAKKSGVHRPSVYQSIKRLQDAELVDVEKKGKRNMYRRRSAASLRHFLKTSERDLDQSLTGLSTLSASVPHVQFLSGEKEMKQLFLDVVNSLGRQEVFYRYIACGGDVDTERFVPKNYRPIRDKKSIQQIAITSSLMKTKPFKKGMGCLWKVLPEAFEHGAGEIIYGSKVAFIDYHRKQVFILESKPIADMQRSVHRALYDRLDERVT